MSVNPIVYAYRVQLFRIPARVRIVRLANLNRRMGDNPALHAPLTRLRSTPEPIPLVNVSVAPILGTVMEMRIANMNAAPNLRRSI